MTSTAHQTGDTHNFGQHVRIEVGPTGERTVCKPRPVAWEGALFGRNSPLLTMLASQPGGRRFSRLAQLEVVESTPRSGRVKYLKPGKTEPFEERAGSFSDIAAYALACGVPDLNHENLVDTGKGFIAVDVEAAFMRMPSLSATGLVANRAMLHGMTGLAKALEGVWLQNDAELGWLLGRFLDAGRIISDAWPLLEPIVDAQMRALDDVPMRVIFRHTAEYMRAVSTAFYDEERVQLERGDIPYFFVTPGDSRIRYYADSRGAESVVSNNFQREFEQRYHHLSFRPGLPHTQAEYRSIVVPRSALELIDVLCSLTGTETWRFEASGTVVEVDRDLAIYRDESAEVILVRKYLGIDNRLEADGRFGDVASLLSSDSDSRTLFIQVR